MHIKWFNFKVHPYLVNHVKVALHLIQSSQVT